MPGETSTTIDHSKVCPKIGRWIDDGRGPVTLIGSHCTACDESFFPEHRYCIKCGEDSNEEIRLIGPVTLRTYTIVHQLPAGFTTPLVIGYGEFKDGVLVLAPIIGITRDQLREGTLLEVRIGVTRIDEDGEEIMSYQFVPVDGSKGA